MSIDFKVMVESASISEADLQAKNKRMFSDECHDGSSVYWMSREEDLKNMGCGGMTVKSIEKGYGYFCVQTLRGDEYACRIHALHSDSKDILAKEYCIRFIDTDMGKPVTLFIKETRIGMGLCHSSARLNSQQDAFNICFNYVNDLSESRKPEIPKRSMWFDDNAISEFSSWSLKKVYKKLENGIWQKIKKLLESE